MRSRVFHRWRLIPLCSFFVAASWATSAAAQTVSGQARVAQVTRVDVFGTTTTVFADTGTLDDSGDARRASQATAAIPDLLSCGTLHATTIGWPDQVASESALANLLVNVAGNGIGADFVMSRAKAVQGGERTGTVLIEGLSINGLPITVTGAVNQTVTIPGGRVVINEQQTSPNSIVLNALHVIVSGVADVVVGSAAASVQ